MKSKCMLGTNGGSPHTIANRAIRFYTSAENNMARIRERHRQVGGCANIEHYTDVIAESSVAVVLAEEAGDKALVQRADRLVSKATHAQRGAVKACEVGTRRARPASMGGRR